MEGFPLFGEMKTRWGVSSGRRKCEEMGGNVHMKREGNKQTIGEADMGDICVLDMRMSSCRAVSYCWSWLLMQLNIKLT